MGPGGVAACNLQLSTSGIKSPQNIHHELQDASNFDQSLRQILRVPQYRRALLSAVPTLTLGIMGGAVVLVSWAFSITGIVVGFLIMLIVASANAYTCDLLLRQAYATGTGDYESLGFAIGGSWWRLATEISIVVLLVGSLVGGVAQVGEAGATGLTNIWPNIPSVFVDGSGRLLMVIATLLIIGPLCLVRGLRQLEYAGIVGTIIVLWMMVVIVIDSCKHGLPAISNGALPTTCFTCISGVPEAVSVFGFAFYLQPMMMPLLLEMPKGKVGVKLTSWSARIVVLVNAFVIYGIIGFFGATYYGTNTQPNILVNHWLGGGVAQGIMNLCMTLYLAMALPMLELPARHTIDRWIPQEWVRRKSLRHVGVMIVILGFSLALAMIWPSQSGNIVVVTGATGVVMVSYIIPVVNHFLLYFSRAKCQRICLKPQGGNEETAPQPPALVIYRRDTKSSSVWWRTLLEPICEVVLPVIVAVVGIICSIASLMTLWWDS